jgi:hypothetical protein
MYDVIILNERLWRNEHKGIEMLMAEDPDPSNLKNEIESQMRRLKAMGFELQCKPDQPFGCRMRSLQEATTMECPKGCTLAGHPQKMRELDAQHYVCQQCQHEIREKDPQFVCSCARCSASKSPANRTTEQI